MRINPSFIKEMTLPETTSKLEHLFADNKVFFAWLVNPVNIEYIEYVTVSTVNAAATDYTFYTVPSGKIVDIVSLACQTNDSGHNLYNVYLHKADGDTLPLWFPTAGGAGGALWQCAIPAINIRGLEEGDHIVANMEGGAAHIGKMWFGMRDTLKSEY